jgi:biotin carboxylase
MPDASPEAATRILILATAHSYRLEPFLRAARKMRVEVVRGLDVPPAHAESAHDVVGLDFRDPLRAVRQVKAFAATRPFRAVVPTDDAAVVLAAHLAQALGLPHNSIAAAEAARDKHRMRQLFAQAGVPSPWFKLFDLSAKAAQMADQVAYPCVLKPLGLSGSRGVIRANHPGEFRAAYARLRKLLARVGADKVLVEGYLPGGEVALEGLLTRGHLDVLALFDKPDPLEGPYFEETIYVTPSRLRVDVQQAIIDCATQAARALGLREGPAHAELRVNESGPWMLEIAGRSIGGLCSQTLRFGTDLSLEELILRHALGMEIVSLAHPDRAARPSWSGTRAAGISGDAGRAGGVMMIPIPGAGTLTAVGGLDEACAVPGIESVEITARLNYPLIPLPEGDSYLGFIFARGETPEQVEAALRAAHQRLSFEIEPDLPRAHSVTG